MAKLPAHAKKRAKKKLIFFKKDEQTTNAHFFLSRLVIIAVILLVVSSLFSFIYHKFSSKTPKASDEKTKLIDKPKRKPVKPLDESKRPPIKEYNFYTQLEQRTFYINGEEKTGGEALEMMLEKLEAAKKETNIQPMTPPIILESLAKQVNVATSEAVKQQQKPPEPKTSNIATIVLQTGSFLSQSEAVNQRTILESHGLNPKIIEAKNKSNQTIYRVHIGPYAPSEIERVKTQLSKLKIPSFKVKS